MIQRLLARQVCFAFGRWFLAGRVQGIATAEALSAQQAEGLRHILTDLGPAFVKIGQVCFCAFCFSAVDEAALGSETEAVL